MYTSTLSRVDVEQLAFLQEDDGGGSMRGHLMIYKICALIFTFIMPLARQQEEVCDTDDKTARVCTVTMGCRMPGLDEEGALPFEQLPHHRMQLLC